MKTLIAAAALAVAGFVAPSASAITYTSFCETSGSSWASGAHPGRCSLGDTSTGTADITSFNAGSFGPNQGMIFKGYGDDHDLDIWQFTATTSFGAYVDLFAYSGVGKNTGVVQAVLTDMLGNQSLLTSVAGPTLLNFATGGTYTIAILGGNYAANGTGTNLYDYDIRVAAVPVPAAALFLGTALVGLGFAGRRRKS